MSNTVTREQVRSMLRKMLPEFDLKFADERADEAVFTSEPIELSSDDLIEDDRDRAGMSALDRLDRAAQWRDL